MDYTTIPGHKLDVDSEGKRNVPTIAKGHMKVVDRPEPKSSTFSSFF